MGSANQVPYSNAGYDARDIRRSVLALAADLCTIISRVLAQLVVPFVLDHSAWAVRFVAGEHRPNYPGRLVGHGDGRDTGGLSLQ